VKTAHPQLLLTLLTYRHAASPNCWQRCTGFMLYADSEMVFQSWRAFGGGDQLAGGALSDLLPGACLQ
jgi:hypothetical protein